MKYIIGITASQSSKNPINLLNNAYIKAFSTDITTPIIIPCLFEYENEIITPEEQEKLKKHIDKMVETCHALVLSGGADLNPALLNEKITDAEGFDHNRDIFEAELVKAFIETKKPIFGICRGFQILGSMLNLNYFQQDLAKTDEIHSGNQSDISNRKEPMHNVHIFGEFKKYLESNGLKDDKIATNSWHHQGFTLMPKCERIKNKDLEDFITEAKEFKKINEDKSESKEIANKFNNINIIMCTNHVIEGFEHKTMPILAFQNHPEEYTNSLAIKYFLDKYLTQTI